MIERFEVNFDPMYSLSELLLSKHNRALAKTQHRQPQVSCSDFRYVSFRQIFQFCQILSGSRFGRDGAMSCYQQEVLLVIKIHPDECDSPFTIDGGGTGSIHYGVPSKLFTRARDDQEGLFCAFLFFSTESQNLFVLFQIPVLHVSTRNQD